MTVKIFHIVKEMLNEENGVGATLDGWPFNG